MEVQKILAGIEKICKEILREKLVGVYLHGSLAFGCFEWTKSDVDFLVVVNEKLASGEKEALISGFLWLNEKCPPKGIEMSVVLDSVCRPFVYPTPYELHLSNAHTANARADLAKYCREMQGVDPDLAAHFTVTRAVGQVLCGRPVAEVFGEVPKKDYLDSILGDAKDAGDGGIEENPVYFVLNLCRVLAYIEEEKVLSKRGGGEWGLKRLPEEHHGIIRKALADYAGGARFEADDLMISSYREYMMNLIFG